MGVAILAVRPKCDIHRMRGEDRDAHYDAKTKQGPWAYVCGDCLQTECFGTPGLTTEIEVKD